MALCKIELVHVEEKMAMILPTGYSWSVGIL